MGDKKLNVHQKIIEVKKVANAFYKDSTSGSGKFSYNYVSGDQILRKIRDKMIELNLLLLPSTKAGNIETHNYKTAAGKEKTDFIVSGEMCYMWIDGDNPNDAIICNWAYYGQQDEVSKAYGSALTYSERYFLLKSLKLPTDEDDPDTKPPIGNSSNNKSSYSTKSISSNNPTSGTSKSESYKCTTCKANISESVHRFSSKNIGRPLCMDCQKKVK